MSSTVITEPSDQFGLVVAGYASAVLLPFIGFILGLVIVTRPDKAISRHGLWVILLSVIAPFAWVALLIAAI